MYIICSCSWGFKNTREPVRVLNDISGIKHILNLAKNSSVKHVFFLLHQRFMVNGWIACLRTSYTFKFTCALCCWKCWRKFLKSYYQGYGLTYTIFRFFNTYGPNQSTDFVVSRFLSLALKGEDITIYGDGSQTRTFTYIDIMLILLLLSWIINC